MPKTITSANSVLTLSIPDVFDFPVLVQGYATDDAFDVENVDSAEAVMGVDGFMSAGYLPFITPMRIQLQADSSSLALFDQWLGAMRNAQEVFYANGSLVIPSIQKSYAMFKGALTKSKQVPSAKKVLGPVDFELKWERVDSSDI